VAALSFFVDRVQKKSLSRSSKNVLDEMALLEKQYGASQEAKTEQLRMTDAN